MSFSSLNTDKQELNFFRKTLKQSKKFLLNLKIDSNISIINCISNIEAIHIINNSINWKQEQIKNLEDKITKLICSISFKKKKALIITNSLRKRN
jgi:hypothetical protein